MDAAIVKFDTLADTVRTAAKDHHLAALARLGLAFWLAAIPGRGFVGRIEVRRLCVEFGGTGIDTLEDRVHVERDTLGRHHRFITAGECR